VNSIVYANNLWLLATNNNIKYSADASNWNNNVTSGITYQNGLAYGNGYWVAVGGERNQSGYYHPSGNVTGIIYSSDGSNWNNTSGTAGFGLYGMAVYYTNQRWIAIGAGNNSANTSNIQYSTASPPQTWSLGTNTPFALDYNSRAYGYGITTNTTSYTASTIAVQITNTGIQLSNWNINVQNNSLVFANENTSLSFTSNFVNNINAIVENSNLTINKLTINPSSQVVNRTNLWVAVGCNGSGQNSPQSSIQYSIDGINWNSIVRGGFGPNNNSNAGLGIAYANGLYVAVGAGSNTINSIQYSTDGSNWSNANSVNFNRYITSCVAYVNNIWLAGSGGSIVSSYDGSNWTTVNSIQSGGPTTMTSFAYGPGIWIACGNCTNTNLSPSLYSYDAQNWYITGTQGNEGNISFNGVVFVNNLFVYVGSSSSSRIRYSYDGINRSQNITGNPNNTIYGITYGNGLYVAVGFSGGNNTSGIYYSSDGINWNNAYSSSANGFGTYGTSITYGNGLWIAVGIGSQTTQISTDGINWTMATNKIFPNYSYGIINSSGYYIQNNTGLQLTSGQITLSNWSIGVTNDILTFKNSTSSLGLTPSIINSIINTQKGSFQTPSNGASTITFSTALPAIPNVTTTVTGNTLGLMLVTSATTTNFTVSTFTIAGAATSLKFNWLATI
jgi:hypothetical protein